jgi:hypothetical protein
MNTSISPSSSPREEPRAIFTDSLRYWELRRIAYNLILTAIFMAWIVISWPHFRGAFTWPHFVDLAILAMFANLCYCAAYLADIPMQFSSFRQPWRHRRWLLWLAGMLFATLLANYWIVDEIYPFIQ